MYQPWPPPPDDDWSVDTGDHADTWYLVDTGDQAGTGYLVDTGDQAEPDSEDLRVEALVAQRLSIDWTTRCQQISVMVQNRVVILAGLVDTGATRRAAADLAWSVPGVHDVCNLLRIGRRRHHR